MSVEIKYTDNSAETLADVAARIEAALEACGLQAETHAKQNITQASRVNTGALRNSVSHAVSGNECYIGTNISYAIFHEYGTGIYIAGGRTSPWSYQDANGDWHRTRGLSPIHFLKHAAEDHVAEYKAIMEQYLKR